MSVESFHRMYSILKKIARREVASYATLFVLAVSLYVAPNQAFAQNDDTQVAKSGSIYSYPGFGMPTDVIGATTVTTGLAGIGMYDPTTSNLSNPGIWALYQYSVGSFQFGLTNHQAEDTFGSAKNSLFSLDQFHFVAPLVKGRLGLSVSMSPVTRSNFRLYQEGTFTAGPDNITFGVDEQGAGGMSRLEVGLGYRITRGLSVGAAIGSYVTSLDNETFIYFSSLRYTPVVFSESFRGTDLGARFGLFYRTQPKEGRPYDLEVGLTYQPSLEMELERSKEGFKSIGGQTQLVNLDVDQSNQFGIIKTAPEFAVGGTVTMNRATMISAEWMQQQWGEAKFELDAEEEAMYSNRSKVGFGIQYHPFRRVTRNGFFHNMKYAVGVSHDSGHLTISGNDIVTNKLVLGLGLPGRRSTSSVDFTFTVGSRGVDRDNLPVETIWGVGVSLNLAEIMFVRPKFQ